MSSKNALKIEKLTKIYSKKNLTKIKALNDLNLEVKEGEIFGNKFWLIFLPLKNCFYSLRFSFYISITLTNIG